METSVWKIISKNTFTLFNLVNIILALMVAFVGSYKNMLFIFIAVANTLIAIINELRAKRTIDKMRIIAEQKPIVIRDGKKLHIPSDQVVIGDQIMLSIGNQVLFDGTLTSGEIEVNESFITGEQDNILKRPGDELISGSFVVSGAAQATVRRIGEDNFVNKLEKEARSVKTADSQLFTLMNNIVKYISYALVPIGILLLWSRFRTEDNNVDAVTSTVAALINMIPEGLILLTSTVLALATVRLGRKKVLVQDMYSIETLARVDTICLDKTGTITTGKMTVKDFFPADATAPIINPTKQPAPAETALLNALELILGHSTADNATSTALKQKFLKTTKKRPTEQIPKNIEVISFSSDRKYSGVKIGQTEYRMGALEFVTEDPDIISRGQSLKGAYRLITVVSRTSDHDQLLGFVRLEDEIRRDAKDIISYFIKNDIDIKIISGDDLDTVTAIAKRVDFPSLTAIDLSRQTRPNFAKLASEYSIFTRVKPAQKKALVKALKSAGHTVAMTGDGVNDILAMKESDCSISVADGSDAARRTSKLVLLDSDFSAVPSIIDEGRQSINNLERSTALFLAKTVYASILAVLFVILPFSYPFSPIEMSLLNFTCIGLPGLILALEHNTERIKNRFTTNIIEYSFPIGFTVSICMLILSIVSHFQNFSRFELTTTSVFVAFIIDLILIYWISRPLNKLRTTLLLGIISIMLGAFLIPFTREFFEFTFLTKEGLIAVALVTAIGFLIFNVMRILMRKLSKRIITPTTKTPRPKNS